MKIRDYQDHKSIWLTHVKLTTGLDHVSCSIQGPDCLSLDLTFIWQYHAIQRIVCQRCLARALACGKFVLHEVK